MPCVFCCSVSHEKARVEEGKQLAVRRKGVRGGLTCSKCNSFACQRCLKSIVMHKHAKPLDRWMLEVKDFLRSNNHPEDFMGHCCEWSHLKQPVPTTASAPLRYDGCLHLFEFALLIDSPFTCVDIHGFGANPPWFKGAWHGAIGEICAARLLRDDVRALGTELRLQVEKPVVLHIPPVHGKGHPTKVLIQIVTAFQSMNFPESALKGSNNPPNEVIASSGFLPPPSKNVDITIVCGRFSSSSAFETLLLLRFHKKDLSKQFKNHSEVQRLFKDLRGLCPRGGFEANRFGGSSGPPEVDIHFFKFLSFPSNFPRRGKGVKLLRLHDRWRGFYIPTAANSMAASVHHDYSPPRPGGSFNPSHEVIKRFQILEKFAAAKAEASLLLQAINVRRAKQSMPLIQPAAVNYECESLLESRQVTACSKSNLLRNMLRAFIAANKHSLVPYAVGYHMDYFDKAKPSLENKVCFKFPSSGNGIGRGGGGQGMFVFALLDWRNELSGMIRRRYIVLGGAPEVTLTQRRLDEFVQQGGAFANLRAAGETDVAAAAAAAAAAVIVGDEDGDLSGNGE